jgi:GntR family transcriptional regulator
VPFPFEPHIPYYFQIKEDIKGQILSGRIRGGEKLANELTLARHYGVSRPTLRQAIRELIQDGFLVSVRGRGTFVRDPVLVDDAETFTVFPTGQVAGEQWDGLVSAEVAVAPAEVAAALELAPAAEVIALVLRRASHGRIVAARTLYVPAALAPAVAQGVRAHAGGNPLEALDLRPARAVQRFQALPCAGADAVLLGVREGEPVMVWQGVLYASDGRRLAYVRTVFLGSAYVFVIHQERAGPEEAAGAHLPRAAEELAGTV